MRLRVKLLFNLCLLWSIFILIIGFFSKLLAIDWYLYAFAVLAIAFSGASAWILHRLVIERIERLHRDLEALRQSGNPVDPAPTDDPDELTRVSREMNRLFHELRDSEEQMDERIRERTGQIESARFQLEKEVEERKSIEKNLLFHKEHLARLAHFDSLTGLPNRILFNSQLNTLLAEAARRHRKAALMFIDIDGFKIVNDSFGHPAGDLLLKQMARRFSVIVRTEDVLSRFGGDEFILMLPDISNTAQVDAVAGKLLQASRQAFRIDNRSVFVTISIGICVYPEHGTSLEELQKNADIAMYHAKRSGGGTMQYFTEQMKEKAHEYAQIEAALRKAVEHHDEFFLNYQPKLDIHSGTMTQAEALIRWNSPDIGMVSPGKFIPLAENSGLIMAIGEWTLRKACEARKAWDDGGYPPVTIAVNLSPKQFRHQNVPELVRTILQETGLDPKWLEIEITETAVVDDVDKAIQTMQALSAMGVSIAMDDFGTGYTSISYLKRFPVSVLKIDQTFVKEVPQSRDDVAIVTGIIALAHSLGMKVVAEGVETAEQLQFLADNDCDIVQGYFLSRPLPEDEFLAQLKMEALPTECAPT